MATEIGHAALGIYPSFDGFDRKLDAGTSKAMMTAGTTGGTKFGDAAGRSAASRFGSVFKTAAKASLIGLAGLGVAAFKFAGDSIEEAREGQKVAALTAAAIKSTDGAAKVTEAQVGDLSTKLSEMAGVDDELVQSGANVLLTFTKIRNEVGEGNKIFDQATLATLNMSAALKTDMSSAAIQVGKALNDPIAGVSALGRAGVQFTEDQKKVIEKLVESGDVLGAQKIILGELETQFKGAAKSQATEADKLTVAWGNFKEEIGEQLLPVMDDLAVFLRTKGIPAARDFAGWVRDDAAPAVKELADDLKPAVGFLKDMVGLFNKLPGDAKLAALGAVLGAGSYMKLRSGGGGALGSAGAALGLARPTPVFVTNWAQMGGVPGGGGGVVAAGDAGKAKSRVGGLARGTGVTIAAALAFAFGDDAADAYMDGFERNSKWAERIGRSFDSALGGTVKTALKTGAKDVTQYAREFDKIPKTLQSRFTLLGVPETERELRHIMDVYDIAAKDRKTTLELLGYDPLLDRIARVNRELDWAARPRQARIEITRAYSNAGYETAGGLVEGDGGNYGNATKRMGD